MVFYTVAMFYYKIWVASQRYHGAEPLTYASENLLQNGQIVSVPMRAKNELGIIVDTTSKPTFTTKLISQAHTSCVLSTPSLQLLAWLREYYPGPSGVLTSLFVPSDLEKRTEPLKAIPKLSTVRSLPALTGEQTKALEIMQSTPGTVLLHGETGTGKTRVYLERSRATLQQGKSVLILTPEIGLTTPLATQFQQALPYPVLILHSNLTPKQRRELWLRIIQANYPLVVIGPRSALFAPFTGLGLIVIDEAHDTSYKQGQMPHYQSSRVAAKLAALHKAQLIMGSATPRIEDYHLASAKKARIVRLTKPAISVAEPAEVTLVDSKNRENFSGHPYISDQLINAIRSAFDAGEQSLVFLNRRGTARVVQCQSCDWQAHCDNCDLPLTYHADKHVLICHTCGFSRTALTNCPVCNGTDLSFRSTGTKAVADSLAKLFPDAVIKRFDTDNVKQERFENLYEEVSKGKVDILVGTQLLVKGHDLPSLSVVGIIAAESSLSFPDYTAEEQTYQQIRQAIGRVGRGHRAGQVIVQARDTENPTLLFATQANWADFYTQQIEERKKFKFPPFVQILKLDCARASSASAEKNARNLVDIIRKLQLPIEILGPTPRFIAKSHGKYHWQIIIKSRSRAPLLTIIRLLPTGWTHDLDPSNLL